MASPTRYRRLISTVAVEGLLAEHPEVDRQPEQRGQAPTEHVDHRLGDGVPRRAGRRGCRRAPGADGCAVPSANRDGFPGRLAEVPS